MAKASANQLRAEYLELLGKMGGDSAGRKAGEDYLDTSYSNDGSAPFRWASNPYILDKDQYDKLQQGSAIFGSIMEKIMAKYQRDRNFRKLFGLDPKIEELTLVPSGCHAAVPLSRIDVFYDHDFGDYKICGIVTGAIDGMVPSAKITRAIGQSQAYRAFAKSHENVKAFDPVKECVLTIMHTYGSWANAEEGRNHHTNPSLAVVDVPNSKRAAETKTIISVMHDLGCYARATDFSQLRIEKVGGVKQLVDNHGPITCVWIRATVDEAAEYMDSGMKILSDATRHGLVCTVGGYRSWPCCTRSFMQALHSREVRDLLSRAENAFLKDHLVDVHVLDPSMGLSDFYDQENWVLRTADGHDSEHAIAGTQMSKPEWRKRLVKGIKRRDAVSSYTPHEAVTVATLNEEGEPCVVEMGTMLGLYVFESRLCGIKATCGSNQTVDTSDTPLEMACIAIDE